MCFVTASPTAWAVRICVVASLVLALASTAESPSAQAIKLQMRLTVGSGSALPPGTSVLVYERPGLSVVLKPPFENPTPARSDILVEGGRTTGSYGRTSRVQKVYFLVAQTPAGELYYSRAAKRRGYDRGFTVLQSGRMEMSHIPRRLRAPYTNLFRLNAAAVAGGEYEGASGGQTVAGAEDFPLMLRWLAPAEQREILQYARRRAATQVDSVRSVAPRVRPSIAAGLALLLVALGFGLGTVFQRRRMVASAKDTDGPATIEEGRPAVPDRQLDRVTDKAAKTSADTAAEESSALRLEAEPLTSLLQESEAAEAALRASSLDTASAPAAAQQEERPEEGSPEAQPAAPEAPPSRQAPEPAPSSKAALKDHAAGVGGSVPRREPASGLSRQSLSSLFASMELRTDLYPAAPLPPPQDSSAPPPPDEVDDTAAALPAMEAEPDAAHEALRETIGAAFVAWCREPGPRLPRYYMFERSLREAIPDAEVYPLFLTDGEHLERHTTGGSEYWAVETGGAVFALPAPRSARGFRGLEPVVESDGARVPGDVAEVVPAVLSVGGTEFEVREPGRLA